MNYESTVQLYIIQLYTTVQLIIMRIAAVKDFFIV